MSSGMVTRVLAFILAAALGGCALPPTDPDTEVDTQEVGEPSDPSGAPESEASARRLPQTPSTLYARSGELTPGEEQSGPFPEPWQQRLGPFPEPWQQSGSSGGGTGSSDPNHKP